MRISDWSSDVCSSDLIGAGQVTHLEPVAGSLEVRLEDSDIAAVEFDNRSIPHDVDVDRDDRREDIGLCEAPVCPPGFDASIRGPDGVTPAAASHGGKGKVWVRICGAAGGGKTIGGK